MSEEIKIIHKADIEWQFKLFGRKFAIPLKKANIAFIGDDPFINAMMYQEKYHMSMKLHEDMGKLMKDYHAFLQKLHDIKGLSMAPTLKQAQKNLLQSIRASEPTKLEDYWNNKRPKTNVSYKTNGVMIDPRIYFMKHGCTLKVKGNTMDDKAVGCLGLVKALIKYKAEKGENWKFPYQTLHDGSGDCEDGAILMANIMINSGIPYWRIRINAGDVKGGRHAYVTYLSTKDNQWYIMDWCYWYTGKLNKPWKDAEKYFGIDFSFNRDYCYGVLKK